MKKYILFYDYGRETEYFFPFSSVDKANNFIVSLITTHTTAFPAFSSERIAWSDSNGYKFFYFAGISFRLYEDEEDIEQFTYELEQ